MARMIPSVIDRSTAPPGEVLVFDKLANDTPDEWTCLHSVDLPQHVRQTSGEIDFLVIVPGQGVVLSLIHI